MDQCPRLTMDEVEVEIELPNYLFVFLLLD